MTPAAGTNLSPADIIGSGLCIGCGGCVAPASEAGVELDRYGLLQPVGPRSWRSNTSASFTRTCPFSPAAADEDVIAADLFGQAAHWNSATGRFDSAYVGAVAEDEYRSRGSSGGMATWTLVELLETGLIDGVAHVVECDPTETGRFFEYRLSRTADGIREGAKSRYYPVELSGVLREIRAVPGRYAVVGVPCFVKAVQLLRREDPVIRERVRFTLALFCGHMKSARFVESFAWQMDVPVADVRSVDFRRKDRDRPASTYTAELTLDDGQTRIRDWWNLADGDWGAGFFQSSACNFCDDVTGETADISFGDAWVEPHSSDGRGTNVVVIRSPILDRLVRDGIDHGRLALSPVDGDFVEQTQAGGLRQRREGLAYRLTWRRRGVHPRKRVAPSSAIPRRRKVIYRMRHAISASSHRFFWLARRTGRPQVYLRWARIAGALYHGVAYSTGRTRDVIRAAARRYSGWETH